MRSVHQWRWSVVTIAALIGTGRHAVSEEPPSHQVKFAQAFYWQTHDKAYGRAAKAFADVLTDDGIPAEIRREATRRMAECEEEVAAEDLASLMPRDAIAYVEISHPGRHLHQIARAIGLTRTANSESPPRPASRIRLEPGLSLPADFALSPALIREVEKIRGAAVAITSIDALGIPQGVLVLHVGDSDLLRGAVETGIQLLQPSEAIEGYSTYHLPVGNATLWISRTARLLILSTSRDQVAATARRLKGDDHESLADHSILRENAAQRAESMLFAALDGPNLAPVLESILNAELRGEERMVAHSVLNLRQIESAAFCFGTVDERIHAEAIVRFVPDHQHLLYGLIRTAAMERHSLELVPLDAAAVVTLGLNRGDAAVSGPSHLPRQVALMDIGRELFANIREVSLFAVSGAAPYPDVGLVIDARDAHMSSALWNQLLKLPSQFGVLREDSARDLEINGHAAKEYTFPEAPSIVVTRHGPRSLIVGTRGAVEASLAAGESGESIITQPAVQGMLDRLTAETAKAALVRVGPSVDVASGLMSRRDRQELSAIRPLLKDIVAGVTVDEGPAELRIRAAIAGLPQISDVIEVANHERDERHRARAATVGQSFDAAAPRDVERE